MIPVLLVSIILFSSLGLLLLLLILYGRWRYGELDNLGFPVIPPTFLLGSVPDIHLKVQQEEDLNRARKYGPIYGLYQGRTPIIFVADPQLIREIFVKDSDHFLNRQPFEFGDEYLNEVLDNLPGEKWKKFRLSQAKLFSSGKLKRYSTEIFGDMAQRFAQKLDNKIQASPNRSISIDAREEFCALTIEIIAKSLLSLDIKAEVDVEFFKACKQIIGEGQTISSFYVWTLAFPFLARFEPTLLLDPILVKKFKAEVSSREVSGVRHEDYGDIMVDFMQKLESQEFKNLGIRETTVLANALNLFIAGFEGIGSTLSLLAYNLGVNKRVQEKLQKEIQHFVGQVGRDGRIDYEVVSQMTYLNSCILEATRLYPVLFRPERVCNKLWVNKERGIRIPEGALVQIPAWAVNRDENIYKSPEEFLPERWEHQEDGNNLNPYAHTTFGFGPRGCLGKRFSFEAIRIIICHLMYRFNFEIEPCTQIKWKPGAIFLIQYDNFNIEISPRKLKN